ncbi:MAG TPA: family 43 glycosylhydrolase, partial [Lachnospiraceae bacterium]|nr:family 43 glycosylhydrolase [Lachnospiraceae bacterium]
PSNPILTHRHLGKEYPIRYVGHADLVNVPAEMTLSGEEKWYMVCLASRPYQGHTMLGRETFLAEVVWEDGWPVVNPGKGKLTKEAVIDLPESEIGEQDSSITFHCDKLPDKMLMLRNPGGDAYSLQAHKGCLRLPLKNSSLKSYESPAFAGVRQTAFYFEASTAFQFFPENETEAAGLVIFQSNQFHLKLQIVKRKEYAVAQAVFVKALTADGMINGDVKKLPVTEELLFEEKICKIKESNCYRIRISCDGIKVSAFADSDDSGIMEKRFAKKIPIEALSTEAAGGFVGNLIGLFAESEEQESRNHADFLFFDIL